MTKVEIINMVASHYNEANRGISDNGDTCEYLTIDGRMCAVGMCMTDEAMDTWKDFNSGVYSLTAKLEDEGEELDSIFKDEYKGHSESFWIELQNFHDESRNWDEFGLTVQGESDFKRMIKYYKNK